MNSPNEMVVVTGIGIISPIGSTAEEVVDALRAKRAGFSKFPLEEGGDVPHVCCAGRIEDFQMKTHIKPRKHMRKSVKVMSRDIQLGVASAIHASDQANLVDAPIAPEKKGVLFGAEMIANDMDETYPTFSKTLEGLPLEDTKNYDGDQWAKNFRTELYPLWMLEYLPNMPACHITISEDARGPNNSLTMSEVSGPLAAIEAISTIRRGMADAMLVGAAASRTSPFLRVRYDLLGCISPSDDFATAVKPFDKERDGYFNGEGAATMVFERESIAKERGAKVLAKILGSANGVEPRCEHKNGISGRVLEKTILAAMQKANVKPEDLACVVSGASGLKAFDRAEAQAIAKALGSDIPVTAPRSFYGNAGAASGCLDLTVGLLAMREGFIPPIKKFSSLFALPLLDKQLQ